MSHRNERYPYLGEHDRANVSASIAANLDPLAAHDIAAAQTLARKKGVPYQTHIKTLLHNSLKREFRSLKNAR